MTSSSALRRFALTTVLALMLLAPGPASASSATVSVQDFSFTPSVVRVGLGESVTWEFHSLHTSTSNQRFWDSGGRGAGSSFAVAFPDAGSFGYHCAMHPSMTGKVKVPVLATGTPEAGYRLRWSVRSTTPADRRFDVRFKRVGATSWTWLRRATAKRAGTFDPARPGSYLVRARTLNVGVGASGWSPAITVRIS